MLALLQATLLLFISLPASAIESAEDLILGTDEILLSKAELSTLPDLPLTANPQIEQLIDVASAELGYTFRDDNTTKYGDWYNYPTAQWCGIFVAWCAEQAGIPKSIIPKMGTTDASWYAVNGTLHYFFDQWLDNRIQNTITEYGIRSTKTEYIPQRGDLVYFKWSDSSYSSTFDHVGIVCGVKDGIVYTVEGNSGYPGTVRFKTYYLTSNYIRAYATPNYTPAEPYQTGYYEVRTSSGLNLREEPTTESSIVTTASNRALLRISEIADNAWGRTEYKGETGWVSLAYTIRQADIPISGIGGSQVVYAPLGYDFIPDVHVLPVDATDQSLTIQCSDSSVLSVEQAPIIRPLKVGTAVLTVTTQNGFSTEIEVHITPATEKGSYSEWITILPPETGTAERIIESKTLYRRRYEYTLTGQTPEAPDGYITVGTETIYGEWSDPITSTEKPLETDLVLIESQTDTYLYEHYHVTFSDGSSAISPKPIDGYDCIYCSLEKDTALPASVNISGGYLNDVVCEHGKKTYYLASHTAEYTYRTRTATINYLYRRATEFSEWSAEKPEQEENMVIQEAVFYRYYDNEVLSVQFLTKPTITDYATRQPLDTTGLSLSVSYLNGTVKQITEGFTYSGYDADLEGTQTVFIHYCGQTVQYSVHVTEYEPTTITADSVSGVWRSKHTLEFDVSDNNGLKCFTIYLDYDASAIRLSNAVTARKGTVTTAFDTTHTAAITFTADSTPTTENGLLFSVELTILREAEQGEYPIRISYDTEGTLREEGKPIRLVVSDTSVTVEAEKNHSYVLTDSVASTCKTEGTETYTCSVCDHSYTTTLPLADHSYQEAVTREPSCTKTGIKTYTCTSCGDSYEESIPMTTHDLTESIEKEATCTEDGVRITVCESCGGKTIESIPATGHKYGEWTTVIEPSCTQTGKREKVCENCSDIVSEVVEKLPHSYTSVTVPPTESEKGYTEYTCTECKHSYRKWNTATYTITFIDHDGTVLSEATMQEGETIILPTAPSRSADERYTYTFSCWEGFTEGMTAQSDLSFTATYTEQKRYYAIIFSDEAGNVYKETWLYYGATITPPSISDRTDSEFRYTFIGFDGYTEGMTVTGHLTIKVLFQKSPKYPEHITSDHYHIDEETAKITDIGSGVKVEEFLNNLAQTEYLTVFRDSKPMDSQSLIGSGMTVALIGNGQTILELTLVVTGDLNGDGKISLTDFVQLKSHLLGKTALRGEYLDAADLNGDGKVSLTDYVKIKAILLGR